MRDQQKVRALIEERSVPIPFSGCWIWERSLQPTGYGDFKMGGKHHYAHRASYEAFVGAIPEGRYVCHRCDVRSCVNPAHLFVGTNFDNIADSVRKGRRKGVPRNRPSGLKYRPMSEAGRISHMKLKPDDRARIVELVRRGMSQSKVAQMFGVSQSCISGIVNA